MVAVVSRLKQAASATLLSVPRDAWFIAALLVASRVVLAIIGVLAAVVPKKTNLFEHAAFSNGLFLSVWQGRDTATYLRIIENGYASAADHSVFPAYPLLSRGVDIIVNNAFVAGLIVSNLALVVACIYLYKLVKIEADEPTAARAVKFLIIWPTAFVLSGVLAESTFLALSLATFYHANKDDWLLAGILGFALALTHTLGVFALLPLATLYMQKRQWRWREIETNALALALIPAAYASWLVFTYANTGKAAVPSLCAIDWSGVISVLSVGVGADYARTTWVLTAIAALVVLVAGWRLIGAPYCVLGVSSVLVLIAAGFDGMLRHTVVIFPFFILSAKLGKREGLDLAVTMLFALLQGGLMAFWPTGILA